jgi:hypothetical protein
VGIFYHLSESFMRIFLIASCIFFSGLALAEPPSAVPSAKEKSVAAIQELAGSLREALLAAMAADGPMGAVTVCHDIAPKLTQEISEKHGVVLGRTALRTRNTNNAPDAWEVAVLEQFNQRLANGEAIDSLAYAEQTPEGFRLMKAIPMGGPCLACHGSNLPESLSNKTYELYPQDQARGFEIGQIRGAFTVKVPN